MSLLNMIPVIGGLIEKALGIIDQSVEDKDIANKIKQEIQMAAMNYDYSAYEKELEAKAAALVGEIKGQSWLQRNWRPVLMLTFTYIIAHNYILAPIIKMFSFGANMPTLEIPPDMWDLLKLGIGGYIVGRSAEKIVKEYRGNGR